MLRLAAKENDQEMSIRIRVVMPVLTVGWVLGSAACAPYLPPTTVPAAAVQSPELESFRTALKTYIDQTQPFRKEAAAKGEAVPNQTSASGSDEAVRLRQRTLAEAIQTKVRPTAQQGDLFPPPVADLIRQQIAAAFRGPKVDLIRDGLQEQTEGQKDPLPALAINQMVTVPRVPPLLLESLPELPEQVEFDFSGRTLILRDVDADLVVDFIPGAFPEPTPIASVPPPSPPGVADAPDQFLALPDVSGATIFRADRRQRQRRLRPRRTSRTRCCATSPRLAAFASC